MRPPESDCQQSKTGKSERVPVRRGGFIEREQCIKCEHWKAKPHQKKPARLLLRTFPQSDYRDGKAEKKQRRIDDKMFPDKREKFQRMKTDTLVDAAARFQMRHRRPGAFLVPSHRWRTKRRENEQHDIETGPSKFHPQLWDERENHDDGEQLKYIGVFTQEPETDKDARQGPVPGKFRALLHHTPKRKHGRDPEKERKRIDRHEKGAKVENRGRI